MYQKIFVVVDDRVVSQSAIHQGIELAVVHRADIVFYFLLPHHRFLSFDDMPVAELAPDEFLQKAKKHAATMLSTAKKMAEGAGIQSYGVIGSGADDSQSVAEAAQKRHCDVIVVGTDGRNAVMRLISESIVPGLISDATVPVLVCKNSVQTGGVDRRVSLAMRARMKQAERLERRRREEND
jgi:nucleotide-binding universal stress UspA family protein